jgi:hypothetical protein
MKVYVRVEQFLTIQFDSVRHADIADGTSRARGTDGLHHRLLRANALQYRINPDSVRHVPDPRHRIVPALCHDVSCAEFAREFLARRVSAHGDDPVGAHLSGRENAEQSNGAVTDDPDSAAWLEVCGNSRKPACAHDVGNRKETRDEVSRRNVRRRDQRTVGEWDAQQWSLRGADKLLMLARRLIAGPAVGTRVVGGEERADDELARLDCFDRAANLFNDSAILVAHRGRPVDRI